MTRRLVNIVLLFSIVPALGWGRDGHRIVGMIAESRLSEPVKRQIAELLDGQPIADAGLWADDIRKDPAYDWSKPLHYVNVPRGAQAVDIARDCPDGRCVVEAIRKYAVIVKDTSKPKAERAEALRFLIHFIADIHQPLHVSHADDRGGNKLTMDLYSAGRTNLHAVWDSEILAYEMRGTNVAAIAERVKAGIDHDEAKRWCASTDAESWAAESLTLTASIYQTLPQNSIRVEREYLVQHWPTVDERLSAAGVRLAAMLESLLCESAAPSTELQTSQ